MTPVNYEDIIRDDATVENMFDLTLANKFNIKNLIDWAKDEGFSPPPMTAPPSETEEVGVRLEVESTDDGFSVAMILSNLHNVGKITAFQADHDFPIVANFLSAEPGDFIKSLGFGYQAKDGHRKEGRVGAYIGAPGAVDGKEDGDELDEILYTAYFSGPYPAGFGVTVHGFALTGQHGDLPVAYTDTITGRN